MQCHPGGGKEEEAYLHCPRELVSISAQSEDLEEVLSEVLCRFCCETPVLPAEFVYGLSFMHLGPKEDINDAKP